jgi:hypothetical protein
MWVINASSAVRTFAHYILNFLLRTIRVLSCLRLLTAHPYFVAVPSGVKYSLTLRIDCM